MIRLRDRPDGLPFRVYERHGKRVYSIGYKLPNGRWAWRLNCDSDDAAAIRALRADAITRAAQTMRPEPIGSFEALVKGWFQWQDDLPMSSADRRAESTLRENRNEAKNLVRAWGTFEPVDISKTMGYEYLDACAATRPEKGNKEMALASVILEWGVRKGWLSENPLRGLRKNRVKRTRRYVEDADLALAVEVGRAAGGSRHIVALALKTAWLCVRRSVEVRSITRASITADGMVWGDGKNHDKPPVLIAWSPELRATIDEALAIKRNHVAGTLYLFGNLRGQPYTKGGWKAVLDDLMKDCEAEAEKRKICFQRFNLQDCRPKAVSDKLERGDTDTKDAAGHTTDKMIGQVYDRRKMKKATPAG
ncbi:hypothetical protein [Ottowia testudinis]|uniref:Integrase n=1 Tax=Ottowia testudinis TaxID=2816950 RepID=A0A975CDV1_9BURK|nr:hypothetical protein [Ottowia testudinis]QTD44585.1 hypothetical protein J1M35_16025 [Ottowia testudinis]